MLRIPRPWTHSTIHNTSSHHSYLLRSSRSFANGPRELSKQERIDIARKTNAVNVPKTKGDQHIPWRDGGRELEEIEKDFIEFSNLKPAEIDRPSPGVFDEFGFHERDPDIPMYFQHQPGQDNEPFDFENDVDWLPPDVVAKEQLLKTGFSLDDLPVSLIRDLVGDKALRAQAYLHPSRTKSGTLRPSSEEADLLNLNSTGTIATEVEGSHGAVFNEVSMPVTDVPLMTPEAEDDARLLKLYTLPEKRQLLLTIQDELSKPGGGRVGKLFEPRFIQDVNPQETDPLVIGQLRLPTFEGVNEETITDMDPATLQAHWDGVIDDENFKKTEAMEHEEDEMKSEELAKELEQWQGERDVDERDVIEDMKEWGQQEHEAHRNRIIEGHLKDEEWKSPAVVRAEFRTDMLQYWKRKPELSLQELADKFQVDKKMAYYYMVMAQDEFNKAGTDDYDRNFEKIVEEELEFVKADTSYAFMEEPERRPGRNSFHQVPGEVSDKQYTRYYQNGLIQPRIRKRPTGDNAPEDVNASFVIRDGKYSLEQLEKMRRIGGVAATPQIILSGMGKSIRQQPIVIGEHGGMWRLASWEERRRLLGKQWTQPRLNKEDLLRDFVFNNGPDPCFVPKPHKFDGAGTKLVRQSEEFEHKDLPKGALSTLLGYPNRIRHKTPGREPEGVKAVKKSYHNRKNKTMGEKSAGKPPSMRRRYSPSQA